MEGRIDRLMNKKRGKNSNNSAFVYVCVCVCMSERVRSLESIPGRGDDDKKDNLRKIQLNGDKLILSMN